VTLDLIMRSINLIAYDISEQSPLTICFLFQIQDSTNCGNGGIAIHGGEIEEKVVVLRELHRAIIYTTELSKQVTEDHVSTAFIAY
jgi:hypothetical protein